MYTAIKPDMKLNINRKLATNIIISSHSCILMFLSRKKRAEGIDNQLQKKLTIKLELPYVCLFSHLIPQIQLYRYYQIILTCLGSFRILFREIIVRIAFLSQLLNCVQIVEFHPIILQLLFSTKYFYTFSSG